MPIGHAIRGRGEIGVVVLHGWFGDHTLWEPTFPILDEDRFTYAFVDYRGYGSSRELNGPNTIAQIVEDTLELADHLDWPSFAVIGHSMGAFALQRIAVDHPERIWGGVCVAPVPATAVKLDDERLELFEAAADDDAARRRIVDFSTGKRLSPVWVDHIVRLSRETTTRNAYAAYRRSFTEEGFEDEVRGLEIPLLVLAGEYDFAIPPELMERTYLEFYPNARLEVIPNSGHYPMQETPVHLATVMQEFLAETWPQDG